MFNVDEVWQYRLWIWRGVLRELGWPDIAIVAWAEQYREEAKAPGWFYHEPASYYLVDAVVPERLEQRLSRQELAQLRREIMAALEDKMPTQYDSRNYDFKPTADHVREILNRYGSGR